MLSSIWIINGIQKTLATWFSCRGSCFDFLLNEAQKTRFKCDFKALITACSWVVCVLEVFVVVCFFLSKLLWKVCAPHRRSGKGRSDGWWGTALVSFPLSHVTVITPSSPTETQRPIYFFTIKSMLYCSASKYSTRALIGLNSGMCSVLDACLWNKSAF